MSQMNIEQHLNDRYQLNIEEYESLFEYNENLRFGNKGIKIQKDFILGAYKSIEGKGYLILDELGNDYHRKYKWV